MKSADINTCQYMQSSLSSVSNKNYKNVLKSLSSQVAIAYIDRGKKFEYTKATL